MINLATIYEQRTLSNQIIMLPIKGSWEFFSCIYSNGITQGCTFLSYLYNNGSVPLTTSGACRYNNDKCVNSLNHAYYVFLVHTLELLQQLINKKCQRYANGPDIIYIFKTLVMVILPKKSKGKCILSVGLKQVFLQFVDAFIYMAHKVDSDRTYARDIEKPQFNEFCIQNFKPERLTSCCYSI